MHLRFPSEYSWGLYQFSISVLYPSRWNAVLVELSRIQVLPGERLLLRDIDWTEFETILLDLGDRRTSRIAYYQGLLEVMAPSPEQESYQDCLGDGVKILLIEWEIMAYPLGSTTLSKRSLGTGIEPDQCFYITNAIAVQGRKRLDLEVDPPPDLAIEIDVTSRTHLEIYAALGVQEVWRFSQSQLKINQLQNGAYQVCPESQFFPGRELASQITNFIQQAQTDSWNAAYKTFRAWAIANRPPSQPAPSSDAPTERKV
ncbi:Uma2 family endonuclease [Alkalinema pantanalense CENA528]|uniref:Uma2 family endonuclease n=1 Tax=Alkalinema pantanalense TaxID=1620705 RepID=UPI003D6F3DB3